MLFFLQTVFGVLMLRSSLLYSVLLQARGSPAYRPYLLALLTHQSNWSSLLQCISTILSKHRDYKYSILLIYLSTGLCETEFLDCNMSCISDWIRPPLWISFGRAVIFRVFGKVVTKRSVK